MAGESQENQEERFGHPKQNFTHSMFDTMWPPLESHISIYILVEEFDLKIAELQTREVS